MMIDPDRARLNALLRRSLLPFTVRAFAELEPGTRFSPNWHHRHIAWQLERLERGEIRRLIINVPPRSMKSIQASIAFPAWVLGRDPTQRIICVSYAAELARKLAVDSRTILTSPWYRSAFPGMMPLKPKQRVMEFATTLGGSRFAAGVDGGILGRGADIIVVDDPIKASDALSRREREKVIEFYDQTLVTRLNDKREGKILIVMQRLHEDDLVGHVLPKDEWEWVRLPAIADEPGKYRLSDREDDVHHVAAGDLLHADREPHDVLEHLRRTQGTLTFSAQYLQAPLPAEGNVIRREWLTYYDNPPAEWDIVIVSWDTASTVGDASDWSVGTVWGAKGLDFYLLDVVREKLEVPDLRKLILDTAERWRANQTLIEGTELGRAISQDLRRANLLRPLVMKPRFDKQARFALQSVRFEAGQVLVPRESPWLTDWVRELLAFPNGRNDDQVDSTSYALHYLSEFAGRTTLETQSQERKSSISRPKRLRRPIGFGRIHDR